ncbi:MAG: hypothetical protein M3396_04070 [Actinomycetota bacterium]|nr:hypothetical protein [Actinomycetota bacterium]MDQ3575365.1 hypothetical protein [Actinomycetota bacterium]
MTPAGLLPPQSEDRVERRAAGEVGSAAPAYVLAVGLSLIFFVLLVQFVVWQYGRGVVRSALDEGARVGSPAQAGPADCEARARAVVADLMGGAMGDEVRIRCTETATQVLAEATVTFRAWLGPSPDWSFKVAASARKEWLPS